MATETAVQAEQRAAIDRLRKLREGTENPYEAIGHSWYEIDHRSLAGAYFAEHPADDAEPVTDDWLKSVGFTIRGQCYGELACPPGETRWSLELDQFGALPVASNEHPFRNYCKTRGEIRRLCSALGIELTTTS